MKKSKIKKAIRDCIVKTYGDAGYTQTADKFLVMFNKKLDRLYTDKIYKNGKRKTKIFNKKN